MAIQKKSLTGNLTPTKESSKVAKAPKAPAATEPVALSKKAASRVMLSKHVASRALLSKTVASRASLSKTVASRALAN